MSQTPLMPPSLMEHQQQDQQEYDYEDYEELEPQPFALRHWKWIVTLVSIPFIYIIFLALYSLPEFVHFDELVKFATLSKEHNNQPYKRLLLIGDVHGCFDEFQSLLTKSNYSNLDDQVVLLGDFISKGPDSIPVLDFIIENNISAVLGNHELNILSKYQNSKPLLFEDGEKYSLDKPGNIKSDAETRLARHLTPLHVQYLSSLPLVLDIGQVERGRGLALHVGFSLDALYYEQSINDQLQMDRDWYKEFNSVMKDTPKSERLVVYYGHNAKYGLNLKKYTKGLDSSCVNGGQLTALILDDNGEEQDLVQVDCQHHIYSN